MTLAVEMIGLKGIVDRFFDRFATVWLLDDL
jgi:hypothetical protein